MREWRSSLPGAPEVAWEEGGRRKAKLLGAGQGESQGHPSPQHEQVPGPTGKALSKVPIEVGSESLVW